MKVTSTQQFTRPKHHFTQSSTISVIFVLILSSYPQIVGVLSDLVASGFTNLYFLRITPIPPLPLAWFLPPRFHLLNLVTPIIYFLKSINCVILCCSSPTALYSSHYRSDIALGHRMRRHLLGLSCDACSL
jgi:hypothetical protein